LATFGKQSDIPVRCSPICHNFGQRQLVKPGFVIKDDSDSTFKLARSEKIIMGRFAGKGVLILGASSPIGIGAATARAFAAEGAKVVISGRRREMIEAMAAEVGGFAIPCDVTDFDQVGALAAQAVEVLGGLDVAINTVAQGAYGPIRDLTPESVMPALTANYVGGLYFLKHMCNAVNPDGAVLMTSSSSVSNGSAGLSVYASSKAAINHAIRVAAIEYMDKRLRINAVEMSLVLTDSTPLETFTPDRLERFAQQTPLGRIATADECAQAYLFAAQAFMTGRVIDISGGGTLTRASMS
jgi:NAD(P)-dependent dehydrogenase (short-subunit alcohol dehydrogenase family)